MFKEKLVEIRNAHKDTQDVLAAKLSVSRSLIAKWEQGRAIPNIEYINKLCEIYSIEFEDLLSKKELKDNYGIIQKKNKNKSLIIAGLCGALVILSVVSILLGVFLKKNHVDYTTDIISHTEKAANFEYNEEEFSCIITLENNKTLEVENMQDINISINGFNTLPSNVNYEKLKEDVICEYEQNCLFGNGKLIKETNTVTGLTFGVSKIDTYDVGISIDFDEEHPETDSIVYFKIAEDDPMQIVEQSDFSYSCSIGKTIDSVYGFQKIDVDYTIYLDRKKFLDYQETNNMNGYYSINYLSSDGTTHKIPQQNICGVYIPYYISIKNNMVSSYKYDFNFTASQLPDSLSKSFNSPQWIDYNFEIKMKTIPSYYEIVELNDTGYKKTLIYSKEDAMNFTPSTDTKQIYINSMNSNGVATSSYLCDGYLSFEFSNEVGLIYRVGKDIELN